MESAQENQLRDRIEPAPDDRVLVVLGAQGLGGLQWQAPDQITCFAGPSVRRMLADALDKLQAALAQLARKGSVKVCVDARFERLAKRVAGGDVGARLDTQRLVVGGQGRIGNAHLQRQRRLAVDVILRFQVRLAGGGIDD